MEQQKLTEVKKPKKAKQADPLEQRIKALEDLVVKMASLAGQHNLPREFGLEPWNIERKDMVKYK